MEKIYSIELTENEFIVLSDFLYRLNNSSILKNFFEDQAEERVLWNLESTLEKNTPGILSQNYKNILLNARNQLRD